MISSKKPWNPNYSAYRELWDPDQFDLTIERISPANPEAAANIVTHADRELAAVRCESRHVPLGGLNCAGLDMPLYGYTRLVKSEQGRE